MRNSYKAGLLAAVFGSGLLVAALPAGAETLADAIALAYQTNPTLLTQRITLRNADESYFRTRAGLGPSVTANVGISAGTDNDLVTGGSFASGFPGGQSAGLTTSITASQPIYQGGRLSNTMDGQRITLANSRESYRTSEHQVMTSVVQAYTAVRQAEAQLAIAQAGLTNFERALNEAQARFDVGSATITETAQARSSVASQQAQLTSTTNSLNNARTSYLTVVGQMPGTLAEMPSLAPALPATVEEAFTIARQNNPALRQAYLRERTSAIGVATARAARSPTVSLSSSISGNQSNSAAGGGGFGDYNAGLTTGLSVSIPIYTGRTTNSSIRTAEDSHRSDEIAIQNQLRTLNQQIQQAWNAVVSARATIVSQTQAAEASTLAADGTREEQSVGLRTSLDVLNAEQQQRNSQNALINSQFAEYTASVQLLVAMGVLEPETFGAVVEKYDPDVHFDQINSFDLPWVPVVENLDRLFAPKVPERIPAAGEIVPQIDLPR